MPDHFHASLGIWWVWAIGIEWWICTYTVWKWGHVSTSLADMPPRPSTDCLDVKTQLAQLCGYSNKWMDACALEAWVATPAEPFTRASTKRATTHALSSISIRFVVKSTTLDIFHWAITR